MSQKKNKQQQTVEFCGGNYALIPLLLVIFLVPLIVHAHVFDPGLSQFAWFPDRDEELDIFLFWKGIVLTALAAVMTVMLVVKMVRSSDRSDDRAAFKREYWLYFLLGYGVLTLVSTIVSPYRKFGFTGIYEQFESVWVILSYCVVTFYAYYIVRNDEDIRVIKKALFYLLCILCFIGVSQLIGKDFFESDLGRRILIPETLAKLRADLDFKFSGSGVRQVYLTLYNPNYVGMFSSLILPVTVILIFASKEKIQKIIWGILSLILLVCTFGSGSKTFILALGGVAVVALVFYRKILLRYWKAAVAAVALIGICGTLYFSYRDINLFQYMKNSLIVQGNKPRLEALEMKEDSAVLVYNGNPLEVQYTSADNGIYFRFSDIEGTELDSYSGEDGMLYLSDERFSDIGFTVYKGTEEYPYLVGAVINGSAVLFTDTSDGYRYVNSCGKVDEIVAAPSAVFTNYDDFASGRGYIWSRTIPLLKKYFFLGSGADTFVMAFPQNDYLGRFNGGYNSLLITKPHNLYLQIGVQHGVLALLCYLAVCLIYLLQSFRLYWKADMGNARNVFGVGVMLGIVGYLISGMANDSSVSLAPLFWSLLGIGFAVNRMNKKEKNTAGLVK